jgi:hypothetical protein
MSNAEAQLAEQFQEVVDFKKARNAGEPIPEEVPAEKPKAKPDPEQEEEVERKPQGGFQKRIDRLTKANADADRRAAEAEERAAAAERRAQELEKGGKGEAKPKGDDEPKPEDFTVNEDYWKALGRWTARQEIKAEREAQERAEDEANAKAIFAEHNQKISEARAKYDDFDDVVRPDVDTPWKEGSKADLAASQAFQIALIESGNGGEIMYYLAKHPDELAKLGGLTPARVQMAVGRIADKLEAKPKTQKEDTEEDEQDREEEEKPAKRKLPEPIKPVEATSRTSRKITDDDLPLSDFKRIRNEQDKYRR